MAEAPFFLPQEVDCRADEIPRHVTMAITGAVGLGVMASEFLTEYMCVSQE
jgi:hypothetical protein